MNVYLLRVLICLVGWRIVWHVIYWATGFYVGYLSINNGISLNDVHLKRGIIIKASSVRLRLWGNSRKLVISDLQISVQPRPQIEKQEGRPKQISSEALSIYPSSVIRRFLIKSILRLFKSVDIEIKDSAITHAKFTAQAKSISLLITSHRSLENNQLQNVKLQISMIQALCQLKTLSSGSNFLEIGTSSTSLSFSINRQDGLVSNLASKIYLDEVELDLFIIFKTIVLPSVKEIKNEPKPKSPRPKLDTDSMTNLYKKLSPCFGECSINIASFFTKGIPLFPASPECGVSEYFDLASASDTLYTSIDTASIHLGRVLPDSAGYDIHFNSAQDVPLHVTFSSQLVKAGFESSQTTLAASSFFSSKSEFLSFPNFSFTFKTNVAKNLIHGLGFKNCLLEFFSSGSSPMLDFDDYQLALIAYNYTVWRKILTVKKLTEKSDMNRDLKSSLTRNNNDDINQGTRMTREEKFESSRLETDTTPRNSFQDESVCDKLMLLLKEFYPKIDVTLTVEQPRILIRTHKIQENRIQMIMLSYSLMILHMSTTETHDYNAECQLIHPNVTFSEKSDRDSFHEILNEEICGLADAKLKFEIFKDFKLNSTLRVHGGFINLSKPDVLNGIHDVLSKTTTAVTQNSKVGMINLDYGQKLSKVISSNPRLFQKPSKSGGDFQSLMFKPLPQWLISFSLRVEDIRLKLGSASPLLPPHYIAELSRYSYQRFDDTEEILSLEIEAISIKIEDSNASENEYPQSIVSFSHASSSSETLASDPSTNALLCVSTNIEKLKLSYLKGSKKSSIMSLPSFNHKFTSFTENSRNRLLQENFAKYIQTNIDRQKLFVLFGSAYLITQTIVRPLGKLFKNMKQNAQPLEPISKPSSNTHLLDCLTSSLKIEKIDLFVNFSSDFEIRLQNYDLEMHFADRIISVLNKFLRVMVKSPTLENYWDRILCVDSLKMKTGDSSMDEFVTLNTKSIRLIQPHGFVVYKLFDNLSVFAKISKHLAKCFGSGEKSTTVSPRVSKPIVSPGIKLRTNKLSFTIEDDPFDSELNMIFQLGLVEQRKRLEHISILEQKMKENEIAGGRFDSELSILHKYFERSWVRKVCVYKEKLKQEFEENSQFLFGCENDVPQFDYDRIKPYSIHAPLLSVSLMGLTLDICKPNFGLDELPEFIHLHGQGVPKDTKYNLMIPTFMDLKVSELRMHLRDYPLPLLHLPYTKDAKGVGCALKMSGHLIICESLLLDKKHLRELTVQLSDATNKPSLQPNAFDKLVIQKSLSTVKLYTDMCVLFDSDAPSRFVWGQSYQFGIQQIILAVDQFSKPPVDPSIKLGFWDKLRFIIHGTFSIETGKFSSIEVAFKAGKDPYDIFGKSNGFILGFKDSVVWKINQHDDSSKFFEIRSEKLSWYIPNYLANPLVCWTRESSKSIFLPADKSFVNSCFGYYLGGASPLTNVEDLNWCEKNVVELSGGIEFTVGFLLERLNEHDRQFTTSGKPHYEIELFNPKFTEKDHDSYKGFRSDRLHMAISLKAHSKDSYNTIHLSPGVFKQIFFWWKMFQGNLLLPIRKGKLFQETKGSQKFSSHLFTNKFCFDIGNLFISHIFQEDSSDSENDDFNCVGLRAKVDQLLVDLHQQKEQVVDVKEDLARHKKVMKMRFNLGQVLINKIDLRTVEATFHRDIYNLKMQQSFTPPKNFLKIFDNDKTWFDHRDYEECFRPFIGDVKSAKIFPFLYSETFAYVRDTTNSQGPRDSSAEQMHSCILNKTEYQSSEIELYKRRLKELQNISKSQDSSSNSLAKRIDVLEKSIKACESERKKLARHGSYVSLEGKGTENFHNRFLLVSMFLKWNENLRNQFMKYIYFVKLSSIHRKFLSYEFMNILEGIIEKQDDLYEESSLATSSVPGARSQKENDRLLNKTRSSRERFESYNEIIRSVGESEDILENYKIEIISPQIQLHSKDLQRSVVMITAPSLESKIVSVVLNKDAQYQNNSNILEKRYGVILHDASVMVIDEGDVKTKQFAFEMLPYGTKTNWPPFLGIETCKNHDLASPENVLIQQMSLMLTFNQMVASSSNIEQIEDSGESQDEPNHGSTENGADKLRIDVPKIVIDCTSKQYFTLYATIFSLMLYVEPMAAELREKIRKLNFSIDFQDFRALQKRLRNLYEYVQITNELLKNYNFRQNGHLDNEDLNDYLLLENKKASLETEIVLMQHTLFSGDVITDSLSHVMQDWLIAADEIQLHMLNDDRSFILDLNIEKGVYKRTVKDDGSNDNRVEILSIEGHSHLPNSHFKTFLEPIENLSEDNLVEIDWSMNRTIGGIKLIDNFDVKSLPLNVRIDEEIGRSLMEFIFRQSESEDLNKSPVLEIADRAQAENDRDEEADDEVGSGENKPSSNSCKRMEAVSENQESSAATSSTTDLEEDVKSMISRSKKYLSIAKMSSQSFEVMISLRMKNGIKKWLNVTNFLLVLPLWKIERKIMSLLEVVDYFKSVVIRALMSHSGDILKNKLSSRRKNLERYKKMIYGRSSRISLKGPRNADSASISPESGEEDRRNASS